MGLDTLLTLLSVVAGVGLCRIILQVTAVPPEEGANIGGGLVCLFVQSASLAVPAYFLQRKWKPRMILFIIPPLLIGSVAASIADVAVLDTPAEEVPTMAVWMLGAGLLGAVLGLYGDWRRSQRTRRGPDPNYGSGSP